MTRRHGPGPPSAGARAGRAPETVALVAVSKRKPTADILAACAAGLQNQFEPMVDAIWR